MNKFRKNSMRKGLVYLLLIGFISLFFACGVNRQKSELNALKKCKFELVSVNQLTLAGADLEPLLSKDQLDLSRIPSIAFGYLNQDLPLRANIDIKITNPTNRLAGVKQFKYILLIDDLEVIDGTSDLPVQVPGNSAVVAPIALNANVYKLIANSNNLNKVLEFLGSENQESNPSINLTIKVKPTIDLGNKAIDYPGYFSVEKRLDKNTLKRLISNKQTL